ncbi:MAG: histidine phosphatase family protein [Magnetococcales bacterium]|nr:histidine phosphatase family protein [Magnetococcales bacterium]
MKVLGSIPQTPFISCYISIHKEEDLNRYLLIDFLRHGEVSGGPRFNGRSDPPLTPAGWQAMERAAARTGRIDGIVTSPLSRCATLAHEWGRQNLVSVLEDPGWSEYDFGRWEGRTSDEIMAMDPQGLAAFWQDPLLHPPPGGEPMDCFRQRIANSLHALWIQPSAAHLLVMTHAGVIRQLAALVLERSFTDMWTLDIPLCACLRSVWIQTPGSSPPRLLYLGMT